MPSPIITRRTMLSWTGLGVASAVLPLPQLARAAWGASRLAGPVRLGLVADVHQDVMHDAMDRIARFADAMNDWGAHAAIQLGDFCIPHPRNDPFLAAWRRFAGPRYHVVGNHDTDGGYTREQTAAYYGMPARYYSFDLHGLHMIVLDGNDRGGTSGGYPRFIAEDQLAWLRQDLAETHLPTLVFIHQPLDSIHGVDNRAEVRAVLEHANEQAGWPKVLAVFAGHTHLDHARRVGTIYHIMINSASYLWVGGDHQHESYPPEIHAEAPSLRYTCPYREPLWARVTVDLERGAMTIEGRRTEWVGPSPAELLPDGAELPPSWNPAVCGPRISDWRLPLDLPQHDMGS